MIMPLTLLFLVIAQTRASSSSDVIVMPCDFNALCRCDVNQTVALCQGVPFTTLPSLDKLQRMVIRDSPTLQVLRNTSKATTHSSPVTSLKINNNPLGLVEPGAFSSTPNLTVLDIGHNSIRKFPTLSLLTLNHLQRLGLSSNQIGDLEPNDLSLLSTYSVRLKSIQLSRNLLTTIRNSTFSSLTDLTLLDLSSNHIHTIVGLPFPESIIKLDLSGNLLDELPSECFSNLKTLTYLLLNDNQIKQLPVQWHLPTQHLDTLALNRNLLSTLPSKLFSNNRVTVHLLLLADNYIRHVPSSIFKLVTIKHLSLSVNHIKTLPATLFDGLDGLLAHLDISHNYIAEFPKTIRLLRRLQLLNLEDNLLSHFDEYDFFASRQHLQYLDLSANRLETVPKAAIKFLSKLQILRLADNAIHAITGDDFKHGLEELSLLDLTGNQIAAIEDEAFFMLKNLAELRLAFNPIKVLGNDIFPKPCPKLNILHLSHTAVDLYKAKGPLRSCYNISKIYALHSKITSLDNSVLCRSKNLQVLNLSHNNLRIVPRQCFKKSATGKLKTLVLAHNRVNVIDSSAFSNLTSLETTDLSFNQLDSLASKVFRNLPNLIVLNLSHNLISSIEPNCFQDLPKLRSLSVDFNRLISLDVSLVSTRSTFPVLQLCLSHNSISHLSSNIGDYHTLNVTRVDLSWNSIASIPRHFFWTMRHRLYLLDLSHNHLKTIHVEITSELPRVQILDLSHNLITELFPRSFQASSHIRVLSLSHNQLTAVPVEAFTRMTHLTTLHLDHNRIPILPDDIFEETCLIQVVLSHNELTRPFAKTFIPVRETLTHLDLSFNKITLIATSEFDQLINLEYLNLSSNQILILPANVFANLDRLLIMDLSSNPLLRIDHGAFDLKLQTLILDGCNLTTIPPTTAPNLAALSLKSNAISNLSAQVFAGIRNLRSLDLSSNAITDIHSSIWNPVSELRTLDVSANPIKELGGRSFKELAALIELDIRDLKLQFLDARTIDAIRTLRSVKTSTYSSVRAFRLQELLSRSKSLQSVTIHVDEVTLSYQVQWAFGGKISELSITGRQLRQVTPDAFEGLHPHGPMTFRISDCPFLEKLPVALLERWGALPRLTLDLSHNPRLSGFASRSEEEQEDSEEKDHGRDEETLSHYVTGSLQLSGAPWVCDCKLLWFQRRLLRQRRHLWNVRESAESEDAAEPPWLEPYCIVPGSPHVRIPISRLRLGSEYCTSDATSGSCDGPDGLLQKRLVVVVIMCGVVLLQNS